VDAGGADDAGGGGVDEAGMGEPVADGAVAAGADCDGEPEVLDVQPATSTATATTAGRR
jgi:hypothetical protein